MKKLYLDRFNTFVLLLFLGLFTLIGLEFNIPRSPIFILSFVVYLILLFLVILLYHRFQKKWIISVLPMLAIQLIYIVNYKGELYWILYQFSFIFIILVIANVSFDKKQAILIYTCSIALQLLILYMSINFQENMLMVSIPFLDRNPNANGVAAFAFLISFFSITSQVIISNKYSKIMSLASFLIYLVSILGTDTRSLLLSTIAMLTTFFIWDKIIVNKRKFYSYFWIIVIILITFIFVYPNLDLYLSNFNSLNNYIVNLTGKRIFSGRELIWRGLLRLIRKKPLFGYGSGIHAEDFFVSDLTSHNLYLEISLQTGLIGLTLFFIFLFFLWKNFYSAKDDLSIKIAGSYFVGLMVYQLFELSLLQSTVYIAITSWILLAFSMALTNNNTKPTKENFK